MCKIPQLGQRLDLLLSVRELPESIRDLEPVSAGVISTCQGDRRGQTTSEQISELCTLGGFFRFLFFFPHLCV